MGAILAIIQAATTLASVVAEHNGKPGLATVITKSSEFATDIIAELEERIEAGDIPDVTVEQFRANVAATIAKAGITGDAIAARKQARAAARDAAEGTK